MLHKTKRKKNDFLHNQQLFNLLWAPHWGEALGSFLQWQGPSLPPHSCIPSSWLSVGLSGASVGLTWSPKYQDSTQIPLTQSLSSIQEASDLHLCLEACSLSQRHPGPYCLCPWGMATCPVASPLPFSPLVSNPYSYLLWTRELSFTFYKGIFSINYFISSPPAPTLFQSSILQIMKQTRWS